MAKVVWSARAMAEVSIIKTYLAPFDPQAATRIAARLIEAGESLNTFPNRGRPAGESLRELVSVYPYIIGYEVDGGRVTILSVRHGAQRRDPT